jgi:hypothetical protein
MQAIEVKFYADINGNGKVSAKCQAGRLTRFRDQVRELNRDTESNFPFFNDEERLGYFVALELAKRFNWDWSENYGNMVIGRLPNGNLVFVFTGRDNSNVIK